MDAFEKGLRRIACRKCAATLGLVEKDGKDCGGMPGITYKVCNNCGHAQPKTKRQRKERL